MTDPSRAVLVIHGGAGTIRRDSLSPEQEDAYHQGLRTALRNGHLVLEAGGSALDAVTAAVMALEEDPLFNAGRGAVFTSAGEIEMDAAVMDGRCRRAGAIAGICGPRHPVLAARAVMERTEHVMLAGEGARRFCREAGLEHMDPSWFRTERRWEALQDELARRRQALPDDGDPARKHGTVGAVACDAAGSLAAATSTGGMTGKTPGRVGDCPVIGAGTWADNATCAVSGTGHGEIFIRYAAGHEIDARIRWAGQGLEQAAEDVVQALLAPAGGSGGLIAVDAQGRVALPFNCEGMYRGVIGADGVLRTAIHREDFRTEAV
ncbi:isoaspartyl peptidase/L-asparaginase [Mycobacterium sp. KBS0706]|uniref:isoaspartyl peptidase/L-asparaginase family protein n=1 Tax=Mycobacterium sp. KBS0706 TaxID=2578109 RepID=UPI00110F8B24|nr:isoaspartyl peptidase/L-asparaginase [Mycobacterium sp. KBS0706]TSD88764.1 isoaspartyl peptidase/L-asparaginase [Mycobacterium sp. KBS0706]